MMRLHQLAILLILCCMINTACSKKAVFEGVIAQKSSSESGYEILVIKNIPDEVLENGTPDEIMEYAYQNDNGIIFYVSKREYNDLEVGQKVSVSHSGPAQESLPPKVGADSLEVLKE